MLSIYQSNEARDVCHDSAFINTKKAQRSKRSNRTGRVHDALERFIEVDVNGSASLGVLSSAIGSVLRRVAE
ncbi:hypothetical protein IH601_02855 [Candidatus Bipolaricaulota bacterium]|nr:hypothetical protein [Candidatus Bipolaricaulota bacterium]TFH11021.1 MAG: hypothetical protein E4H08_02295 [Candidatus Atribacteria bacterium]